MRVELAREQSPEPEPNLIDYGSIAWGKKWVLLTAALASGAAFLALSFLIPSEYKATVSLIPMTSSDRFGSLGFLGVELQDLGLSQGNGSIPPSMYPEIVESRAVLEPVLGMSFGTISGARTGPYRDWIGPDRSTPQREVRSLLRLKRNVSTAVDRRTGLMTIEARDRDPGTAADLANAIAESLQRTIVSTLTSQASLTRQFTETRLVETGKDLARAEESLRSFRQDNLRIGNSPHLQLEEARRVRAVREQEEIYLTIERQREMAKIEEHRDVPKLAVLDRAVPPHDRNWPKRLIFLLGGMVVGGALFFFVHASKVLGSKASLRS